MTRTCPDCGGLKAYQSDRCRPCSAKVAEKRRVALIEDARDDGHTPDQVAATIGIARGEVARWCRRHNRDDLAAWMYPARYTTTCVQCEATPVARAGASCHYCLTAAHDRESPYDLDGFGYWAKNGRGVQVFIEGAA